MHICIINGPNLNEIGTRQPEIYGTLNFQDAMDLWQSKFPDLKIELFQSNHEGGIIDYIQEKKIECSGFIINAGAYSHTSIAIADALRSVHLPIIEVHLSNIFQRESYRHHSYISEVAKGCIVGMGMQGYELAIQSLLEDS
jgi:3-dehydroquinate dehydratase-2